MYQIKIFSIKSSLSIEEEVNDWLARTKAIVQSIYFEERKALTGPYTRLTILYYDHLPSPPREAGI